MSKLKLYQRHYRAMLNPLLDMMLGGIRVDRERMQARHRELRGECQALAKEINRLTGSDTCTCGHPEGAHPPELIDIWAGILTKAGKPRKPRWKTRTACRSCGPACLAFTPKNAPVVSAKDLSSKRLAAHLYEVLHFPAQRKFVKGKGGGEEAAEGAVTADEIAVRRLRSQVLRWLQTPPEGRKRAKLPWKRRPKAALKLLDAILAHRRSAKLSSFATVKGVDADGQMRCTYKLTTLTGRLASSKNPMGGGYNLQNVDREIRDCFTADPGRVLLEADYSMGETRLVYALTGDPELVALANHRAKPGEPDIYEENAARMFGCPVGQVSKQQRQDSKQVTLASGYGMTGVRFSELLTKQGIDKTPAECDKLLALYFRARPAVLEYQRWVRQQIIRTRQLQTPWGRVLDLRGQRLTNQTYKQGYAYIPQSTLGDMLNRMGLVPIWEWLRKQGLQSRLTLQVHDALILNCPEGEVWPVAQKLRECLERPVKLKAITGATVTLINPIAIKVGTNWGFTDGKEWKIWPTQAEVEEKVKELLHG